MLDLGILTDGHNDERKFKKGNGCTIDRCPSNLILSKKKKKGHFTLCYYTQKSNWDGTAIEEHIHKTVRA